jgi:hypothetical protein
MKQVYVLPKLGDCIFVTSFDLWMSKGAHDIFALVINFLGFDRGLNMWLLGYLKQQKLLINPWPLIWQNCLINMDWEKNLLHMWKMKGQIYNYLEINC